MFWEDALEVLMSLYSIVMAIEGSGYVRVTAVSVNELMVLRGRGRERFGRGLMLEYSCM
jgi:hypothetical protein